MTPMPQDKRAQSFQVSFCRLALHHLATPSAHLFLGTWRRHHCYLPFYVLPQERLVLVPLPISSGGASRPVRTPARPLPKVPSFTSPSPQQTGRHPKSGYKSIDADVV